MRACTGGQRAGVALGLLLVWVTAGAAQPASPVPEPHSNDDCMMCHADESTTRADGKPLVVDAAKFHASVHGQIDAKCVDCHADVATIELPHAEKLAPVNCATCHETAVNEYQGTAHGKAKAEGRSVAATCVDCHGTHDIRGSKDPESRTYHLNLPSTCGACHGDDAKVQRAHLPGGNVASQYGDSIHGRALTRGGLLVAPSCASCHGAHNILSKNDPASRVAREHVPTTCGGCHEGVLRAYDHGKHGEQVHKDNARAPVCTDCHSAHHIQRAELSAWQVDVISECGTCHQESIGTYRDTFHGQVTALGYTRVATCASCHGAHDVLPASDPASPVSAANRLKTCQKCHPSANENFAAYDPHANRHTRDRNPLLFYAGQFMDLLLMGVFGFFGIHTSLWFAKSLREVRARRRRGA